MSNMNVRIDYTPFLPIGGSQVDAVVKIVPDANIAENATSEPAAQIFVIDNSGSMEGPKLANAKHAVQVGIDQVSENDYFAVIIFDDEGEVVMPLSLASPGNKRIAKERVAKISHSGGTFISKGLGLAADALEGSKVRLGNTILVTDGDNDRDDTSRLLAEVNRLVVMRQAPVEQRKTMMVYCRGVGTGWNVDYLRRNITDALLSEPPKLVAESAQLAADFSACLNTSSQTVISDVKIVIQHGKVVEVKNFRQSYPTILDLLQTKNAEEKMTSFSTGAWTTEERHFYVGLQVPVNSPGTQFRYGQVWVEYRLGGQVYTSDKTAIMIEWSGDVTKTVMNPAVAAATGKAELATAIQRGLAARESGDLKEAVTQLGRAVQLAHEANDEEMATQLKKVVNVEDAATGKVAMKKDVDKADEMNLNTASTVTRRAAKSQA